jgi:hypothetical protein
MNRKKSISNTTIDNHRGLRNLSKHTLSPKQVSMGRTDNRTMKEIIVNGKSTFIFIKKGHNFFEVMRFYKEHLSSYCGCQTRKGGAGVQSAKKSPSYPGDPEYVPGDPRIKNLPLSDD